MHIILFIFADLRELMYREVYMPSSDELSAKLAVMAEPSVTVKEIAGLFACSLPTAGKIKKAAISERGGAVRFNTRMVKTDAVFAVQGLDRLHEMGVLSETVRKMSGAER